MNDLMDDDSLRGLLEHHGFDTSTMRRLHSGPGRADLWAIPCRSDAGWFEDWELLRRLSTETGRWPVANERLFRGDREFHLSEFGERDTYDAEVALASAATIDPWAELPAMDGTYYREDDRWMGGESKDAFDRVFDLFPLDEETCHAWKNAAVDQLDSEADSLEIQRWAVHRSLQDPKPADADYDPWHMIHDAAAMKDLWLTLLPTADPVAGLAYIASFQPIRPDLRVAVAREWNRKHGVEFVGVFGICDLFQVASPPTDPDDIWNIARAAFALWPDIDAGFKGSGHPFTLAPKLPYQHHWSFTIYP